MQLTSSWLLLSTPYHLKHASATNFLLVNPKMTVTNGLTVDAEDYFHVYTYSDVICRENWDVCEQTVERNTYRLLNISMPYALCLKPCAILLNCDSPLHKLLT